MIQSRAENPTLLTLEAPQEAVPPQNLSALCDLLFSTNQTLAVILTSDWRSAYVSPNHEAATGLSREALSQQGWMSGVHVQDREKLLDMLRRYLQTPEHPHSPCFYRFKHADGTYHWYRADMQNSDAFRFFDQKFLNGMLLLSYPASRPLGEEDEKAAMPDVGVAGMVESCSRALVAHMSHELRTPLNAILGYTEMVLAGIRPEEHHAYLQHVRDSSQGMLVAVNELTQLAGQALSDMCLQEATHDIRDLLYASLFATPDIALRCQVPGYPVWAYVDGPKIRQVFDRIAGLIRQFCEQPNGNAHPLITVQCRMNADRAFDIHFPLPSGLCRSKLAPLLSHNYHDMMTSQSDPHQAFHLTRVAQVLALHEARILLDDATPPRLTVRFPATRILPAKESD